MWGKRIVFLFRMGRMWAPLNDEGEEVCEVTKGVGGGHSEETTKESARGRRRERAVSRQRELHAPRGQDLVGRDEDGESEGLRAGRPHRSQ